MLPPTRRMFGLLPATTLLPSNRRPRPGAQMPHQPTHPAARTATWTTAGDQPYVRLTEGTWQTALRSATLLEQAHDAIVGVSADMTINVWNRGAERLYGFREPEATGAPMTILLPDTQLESERQISRRVLAGETVERDTQR